MLPVPGTDYEISTMAESMYKMQRWNNLIAVSKLLAAPIVPENALARRFRDEAGRMNQIIANAVDEVYVSISGIPVRIKPQPD